MKYLVGVLLAVSLVASPAMAQDAPVVFEPATNWQIDYAQDGCYLDRAFGEEDSRIFFRIGQRRIEPRVDLTLGSETMRVDIDDIAVRFLPNDQPAEFGSVGRIEASGFEGVIFSGLSIGPEAVGNGASALQIDGVFDNAVRLETGDLAPAMEAMDSCMSDFYREMGVDPDVQFSLSRPAMRKNFQYTARLVMNAYPSEMVRRRIEADVSLTVVVDPDGRVTQCSGTGPSEYPQFLEAACEVMTEHARYEPALDADGNPVATLDGLTTSYRLD